jgi:L-ascorbate metabolism protein UlaG (beta-lactamase superfamily)
MERTYFYQLPLIFLLAGPLIGCINKTYYDGPPSDHFDGTHFHNATKDPHEGVFSYMRWKITENRQPWPKYVKNEFTDHPPARVYGGDLRVSYVGHSTVLIQTEGVNILTDPVWSTHAGPDGILGAKRVHDPGIPFDKLPKIDVIVISHNHYDHMDVPTLKKLWDRDHPLILVPLGNDTVIRKHDASIQVQALDWYQFVVFNKNLTVYVEPSQHWSRRFIADRDSALWGGYVFETPSGKIYYSGDTGYDNGDNFKRVHAKHGDFRLALLPIGSYDPRWYLQYHHINPDEAVLAHKDLGEPLTIGVHYDTFQMGDEAYKQPLKELTAAREKYQIQPDQFRALKVGEVWEVP